MHKVITAVALAILVSGCASGPPATVNPTVTLSDGKKVQADPVCDGLRSAMAELAHMVALEGTEHVLLATDDLIAKYDAGCPK